MIEFEVLTIKTKTDDLHAIFLLKRNVQADIIKTILRYLLMATPETFKKWKMAIISVEQEYESTGSWKDYQTEIGMTYRGRGTSIDIGKARNNFDKNGKPKCFNYNAYGHMVKDCWKTKKEWDTRKCYKYIKIEYISKDC